MLKKITKIIGNALLVAFLALGIATVLAATDWTSWLTNMTKQDGEVLTETDWNGMVSGIGEVNSKVNTAQSTANTANTRAINAQNTANSAYSLASSVTSGLTIVYQDQIIPADKKICIQAAGVYGTSNPPVTGEHILFYIPAGGLKCKGVDGNKGLVQFACHCW